MSTLYFYDREPSITSYSPSSNAPLSGNMTVNYTVVRQSNWCSFATSSNYLVDETIYSLNVYIDGVYLGSGSADIGSHSVTVPYSGLNHSSSYPVTLVVVNYHRYSVLGSSRIYTKGTCNEYSSANFTTINGPSAFNLLSPSNHSLDQSRRPNLTWQLSSYTNYYEVYVGLTSASLSLKAVVTGTSYQPSVADQFDWNTKYYWKVRACNNNGTSTYSSEQWDFTVMAEPQPPVKPVIVAPLDDATDVPRSQSIQWKDGTGGDPADSYDIYFGTDQQAVTDADTASDEFRTNQSHSGAETNTQSYSPGSLGNNYDYYWRIDAINPQGTAKGDTWHFKTVEIQLGTPVSKMYRKKLIALADDKFWYESDTGLVNLGNLEINSDGGLDLTKPASVVSAYQKIFIVNGALKKVVDFSNTRLTVSSLSHIPERGGILTQANGAAMVIDFIDSVNNYIYGFVTNGTFEISQDATLTEEGTGYDYPVTAVADTSTGPLYYDWQIYPHDDDTFDEKVFGKMPDEPTILALYRGKIVMTGDKNSPHVIYMSELGNPFNYAYGDDTAIAASAITGGYVGQIGDVVTAAVPYRDDYMIIGCSQSLWLMRGDPTVGGQMDQISFTAGVFDDTSYAWDSTGNLYFLDGSGIYKIPADFGAVENLTQSTIPNFINVFPLSPDVHRVTMSYDRKKHGIVICKTDMDTGLNLNFWFDLRTEGFFPEQYPVDCSVYSMHYYSADDPVNRKLLLGSRDGYIRIFDSNLFKDQTSNSYCPIESFALIGPGQTAGDNYQAILTQLNFILDEDSDSIDYELYLKDTAQKAVRSVNDIETLPISSGTISGGRSGTLRPRAKGAYLILKISNSQLDKTWALEKITGRLKPAGAIR
ncbi:MAG: hypothetical protein JW912_07570 [Sedimentisphaerales bacterium]|nr:hypothetical protein [Sedimentisphaerales bacterium]